MQQALISARGVSPCWLLVFLALLIAPAKLPAQTDATKTETAAQAAPADVVPLGRFIPKENLVVYVEFAGLNAHSEAWKKTAASKMLLDTPLGGMLEEVAAQLLDKGLSVVPDKRVSGPEIVTLVKNAAQSGFVMALNINPKGPGDPFRGTFVLRGAASKQIRPIAGRMMGWFMGAEAKAKIEFREGRTLVSVTPAAGPNSAWAWWAEKNDLVVVSGFPLVAESTLATLDGKNPSALEHPIVQELSKPEGSFHPVSIAFADTAACPESPGWITKLLRGWNESGIHRLDVRWGFDDDALMTVARVVAPKPRKLPVAFFDQPTFEKASLLPLPEGVESFVELSVNPARLLETVSALGLPDAVKSQIDEFAEDIQGAGKVDLQKDLLAHLGPRMALYLAPGRSAATTNEESSLESLFGRGLNPLAAVSATQSLLPKLTVVAEVKDPATFAKALTAVITAINNELKAQAKEKAMHEEETKGDQGGGAARPGGRNAGGRQGGAGGDRTKRRRLEDTPAPHFQSTPGEENSYVLITPTASVLRFGPASFRPTIRLDGNYLAFSLASESAAEAIKSVKRKNWSPSATIQKATEHVPSNLMLLMVSDVAETLPSLLANLPGTLQTTINTSIALSRNQGSADPAAAGGANRPAPMGAGAMAGGPRMGGRRGGPMAASPGGGAGAEGAAPSPGNPPGVPNSGGSGANGSADAAMIQFKIDADKLPKAEDLKSYLFSSTLSVTVSDQDIRFVSRSAFPNLGSPAGLASMAILMPALKSLTAGLGQPGQTQAGAPNQPAAATTPPAAPPGGQPGGAPPPGPGGRRRGGR